MDDPSRERFDAYKKVYVLVGLDFRLLISMTMPRL
jgi:hypothetical protein